MIPGWTVQLVDAQGTSACVLVQADDRAEAGAAGRHAAEMDDILSPAFGRAWTVVEAVRVGTGPPA